MHKKLLRTAAVLTVALALLMGMGLSANAASGSGSSTYYYNLQEDHRTAFQAGDEIYVSNLSTLEDPDYIAYGFPSELKAKLEILEYGAYTNGNGYSIKILINGYWDSCNGYLIHQSGNHWKYWCWGGAYQGYDVYIYTCQSGAFAPGDVTIQFDSAGNITGAVLFAGTTDAVPVPASMLSITDNTVNYAAGDYTRTATLGGVNIVAVDSNGIYDQYLAGSGLSGPEAEAIKAQLANAQNDADVQRILAQALALKDVNAAAEAEKLAIDNNPHLSAPEKVVLKSALDSALSSAKAAINSAGSIGGVDTAKADGIAALELVGEKAAAIAAVQQAADAKKAAIDDMPGLSPAEKGAMKLSVNDAADAAKSAVNSASTPLAVTQALENGNAALALVADKAQAISDLSLEAELQKQTIRNLPNLNDIEKLSLYSDLADALDAAKAAVDLTRDPAALADAKADGLAAVQLVGQKAAAADAVIANAAEKKAQIRQLAELSGPEKEAMEQQIDDAAAAARAAIGQADDGQGVDIAASAGNGAIDLIAEKANALHTGRLYTKKLLEDIDALEHLTNEEKQALKDRVTEAGDAYALAVNGAGQSAELLSATQALHAAGDLIAKQAEAMDAVNLAAAEKKAAVKALPHLTEEEKQEKYRELDTAAAAAKTAINQAADEPGIRSAQSAGESALTLLGEKAEAMDAAAKLAADTAAGIQALESLSAQDKKALLQAVDAELAAAKTAINSTADPEAMDAQVAQLRSVYALQAARARTLDTVSGQKHLSDAEKLLYAGKLDTLADTAISALSDAGADPEAIIAAAVSAMEETADDAVAVAFVKGHVSGTDGNIYTQIDTGNADQILSGKAVWAEMTAAQQKKADALIAAANQGSPDAPQSYQAFVLATQQFADASAEDFIRKHLTDDDGKIYPDATRDNYRKILSAKTDWDGLSQAEKDAVNKKLTESGSKTYEALLAAADWLSRTDNPKTGDPFALPLCLMLLTLSSFAMLALCLKRKQTAAQ